MRSAVTAIPGTEAMGTHLLPFLPGEAIKIALAAVLLPMAWKVLRLSQR